MKLVHKISKTRIRSYMCKKCGIHNEIFGDGEPPKECLDCGGELSSKTEYDIVSTSKRTTESKEG